MGALRIRARALIRFGLTLDPGQAAVLGLESSSGGDQVEPELTALTTVAAATLVQLMATDSWDRFKVAIVSLWRRVHPDRAEMVDGELAQARLEVLAAVEAGDDQAELDVMAEWHSRLRRLVATRPELAADLQRLLDEFRPVLGEGSETDSVRMRAQASGHGRVYQAGRDQKIVER